MAVNYAATLKNTRMTAVVTAIDAHASAATLEIATTAFGTVLCIITLDVTASFTVSGAVMTMAGVPRSGTAIANGTAAVARIKEGGGTVIVDNLSVGTSGQDIVLNSTSITNGQTVTITAGTITHAA